MIEVLAFDVFGTVVDWHGSVAREVEAMGLGVDGSEFAREWRAGYKPAMARVLSGELAWTPLDALHRMILDELLNRYEVSHLSESEIDHLNKVWHRLDAWPDSVEGLNRLRSRYIVCSLSNGNLGLLTRMARHASLPWDCILSAEIFRTYKPNAQIYTGVARIFDVAPGDVMLVAAHQEDLDAARACGLGTAYIERPAEYGSGAAKDVSADPRNAVHARDIADLAAQLGC